jgi:hypothetical protein
MKDSPIVGYYVSYVHHEVAILYIRNTLRHRTGPIRIEKPGR